MSIYKSAKSENILGSFKSDQKGLKASGKPAGSGQKSLEGVADALQIAAKDREGTAEKTGDVVLKKKVLDIGRKLHQVSTAAPKLAEQHVAVAVITLDLIGLTEFLHEIPCFVHLVVGNKSHEAAKVSVHQEVLSFQFTLRMV